MSEYKAFYEESLYPLQDGVLRRLESIHSPFYLTGGTALGRELIGHRYSDDLDLFVNDIPGYRFLVQDAVSAIAEILPRFGATVEGESTLFDERYSRIVISTAEVGLKLDFVNDIAFRVGTPTAGTIYFRVDSIENILSNKITALYRYEPKDVADIWAIATRYQFTWSDILAAAKEKESGIDASSVAEIIRGFPQELFTEIKWREMPELETFLDDLELLAENILETGPNTLKGHA